MPDVHPLIRLVMLLVFSTGMALAQPPLLLGGLTLLLILYILSGSPAPLTLLLMIKRLRWLFIAILLVYGWWTPGTFVLPSLGYWSPTYTGLYYGATRILVLLTIVTAVHLLLQTTPRARLLPAIMQLISPVTSTAVRERLAVRMLLVIETVPRVQTLTAEVMSRRPGTGGSLDRLSQTSRQLYKHVLDDAERSQTGSIEVSLPGRPPLWQWLIPLSMCAAVLTVSAV